MGARGRDVCLHRVEEADAVLQQVQHGVAQDGPVQLKGLRAVEGLLDVGRHREGLVGAAPQRLHHLPHLQAQLCSEGKLRTVKRDGGLLAGQVCLQDLGALKLLLASCSDTVGSRIPRQHLKTYKPYTALRREQK